MDKTHFFLTFVGNVILNSGSPEYFRIKFMRCLKTIHLKKTAEVDKENGVYSNNHIKIYNFPFFRDGT